MKISKTIIFISFLLFISLTTNTIYTGVKQNDLQKEITELQSDYSLLKEKRNKEDNLTHIDSLLIKGEYETALVSYKENFQDSLYKPDIDYVQFRIQIAKQFIDLKKQTGVENNRNNIFNNNKRALKKSDANLVTSKSYDSLYNALINVKKQLNYFKNKLNSKPSLQYLKFKSTKKHILHYVGKTYKEKANGYGIALFDTGGRYEGGWKNNKRNGKGVFYWADGEHYEGDYKNDLRNGKGTYFWKNGKKFIGEWKDDKREGKGIYYDKKGKIKAKGIWKNDKLVEETE